MAKLLNLLGLCALAALWSCSFTGEAASEVQSCYDTGHGIVCTTSSELGDDETDADGDGDEDELVCGDADESSESIDDDGTDDDGTDDDGAAATGDDEGEDDGESDGESDAEGDESTSDSASEDCDSSDGDDDNDGLDDGTDCDCGGTGDEPPPPPEDPCTDCTPPE